MARYPAGSKNNVNNAKKTGETKSSGPTVSIDSPKPATKETGKIVAITSTMSSNVPSQPTERNNNTFIKQKWQPFGNDNMFPQAIAQLTRKSPTHRGILNWKNTYITGGGFMSEDEKLKLFIEDCNNKEESLQEVMEKVSFDKLSSGNGYMEIVFHSSTGVLSFFHKDHTTCRVSNDGKQCQIYGDWEHINTAPEGAMKEIPFYPVFADIDGYKRSVYHWKDYEPEFTFYGVPSWLAGMDAAAIAYKTNKWNVSRLDNDFAGSGTLVVEGNISPKEAKVLKKDFKSTYTGEGKTGKVLFIVKQLGGGKTEFIQTNKVSDGDWLQLHNQSTEDLLIANTWFPSLSGMVSKGGLGGNIQQIRTEYQIALTKVIKKEQKKLIKPIKKIIKATTNWKTDDLVAINEAPVEMYDIDMNAIITVGEARAAKGLPVDDTDPTMKKYVSQNKTNTSVKTDDKTAENDGKID